MNICTHKEKVAIYRVIWLRQGYITSDTMTLIISISVSILGYTNPSLSL